MPAPLAIVKAKFENKDKLVDQIVGLLSKDSDEPKDDLRKRLLSTSNSKLLKLHTAANTASDKFGSRGKLVEETASVLGKSKDKDYVTKLESFSAARLIDMQRAGTRRAKNASARASAKAAGAQPRAAKASPTASAAKKDVAKPGAAKKGAAKKGSAKANKAAK